MEQIAVFLIVAAAVAFLGRQLYVYIRASRKRGGGCPSCGSCQNTAIAPSNEDKGPERR
jgi:hypothetical protein